MVFLGAGSMTASIVTARPASASAGSCGTPCVAPKGVNIQFSVVIKGIIDGFINDATSVISSFSTAAISLFTATIAAEVVVVTGHLVAVIETMWVDAILPALQGMTRQLNTMMADQSRALASFTDAANLNRTISALKERDIDRHRALSPGENVCAGSTVAGGLTRAASFRRAYNAAAPAEQAGRSGNVVGMPAATGKAAESDARFEKYAARYCNKNDNNGASGCAGDGLFVGLDIDPAGTIFAKETIDVKNSETRKTVDDLIENIAEPFVKDTVPPGAVDSATGREAILAAESYKARRQVIYDSLYHVVSRRVPGSSMGEFVTPIRLAAGIDPALISDNPSHNEIMQAMMSERFRSGKYVLEQIAEPENNAREMVIQQAFQLMQMSDQLDLMDRYALVLAAQAGAEVRRAKRQGTAAEGAPLR